LKKEEYYPNGGDYHEFIDKMRSDAGVGKTIFGKESFNTLRTGDADLRFYITTVQVG